MSMASAGLPLSPTDSGPVIARLLRHLRGGTLSGSRHLAPRTVAAMGRIVGQVSTTLRPFRHPGLDRVLQWIPVTPTAWSRD
jgi:Ser/Thr protein kinase RdoA (MazF antagonist)